MKVQTCSIQYFVSNLTAGITDDVPLVRSLPCVHSLRAVSNCLLSFSAFPVAIRKNNESVSNNAQADTPASHSSSLPLSPWLAAPSTAERTVSPAASPVWPASSFPKRSTVAYLSPAQRTWRKKDNNKQIKITFSRLIVYNAIFFLTMFHLPCIYTHTKTWIALVRF